MDARTKRRLKRHKGIWLGAAIIALWAALTPLSTVLTGYDPNAWDPEETLWYASTPPLEVADPPGSQPPRWFLLGTNDQGQDMLGLILYGARYSLSIGFVAVGISLTIGVPLGLVAGYFGGRVDALIMRGIDVLMAFPAILLAICIVAVLGQSLLKLMVAVGIVGVPTMTRQLRAQVLQVKELEFVQAARAIGAGHTRILVRHILPNCLAPILVLATLGTATAVLETAGLGFIGLGPEAGTPEWGLIIAENRELVTSAPWAVIAPGVALVTLVLGFNLLGDGLRDVLDPRLQ